MSLSITRNEVTKELSETMFGKKSPNAGVKFLTPVIDVANTNDVVWTGADQLNGMINRGLRLIFADIHLANLERNGGVFDEAEFIEEAADFTAARQSLADIETEIDDLQALQISFMEDPMWIDYEIGQPVTEAQAKAKTDMKANSDKIKALRVKRDAIEKEYQVRAAKRAVTKAANAAKKAAGTPVAVA